MGLGGTSRPFSFSAPTGGEVRLELVTAPTVEPLTLADAKQHLRVTVSDEDALITRHLITARRQVEIMTRRRLITQHWRIYFDSFPWSSSSWSCIGLTS